MTTLQHMNNNSLCEEEPMVLEIFMAIRTVFGLAKSLPCISLEQFCISHLPTQDRILGKICWI
jgi:hypothetical protein